MKKINELTPAQVVKFSEYVEKWLKIGLSTEPLNHALIEKCIKDLYENVGLPCPKLIEYCRSPLEGSRLTNEIYSIYGSQEAGWLSFYDYCRTELGLIEETEKLVPLLALSKLCGWVWTGKTRVLVSERPVEIYLKNKLLHNDNGPAIRYSDDFSVYALNGIRMKKEYVMTPASELSAQTIMKEQNVDVRRELLRKIGLERFVAQTNGVLVDSHTVIYNNKKIEYQLLDIDLGNNITARILKMDNPSINAQHIEGVEETCKTVQEALAWRMGLDTYVAPEQLT